MIIYVLSSPDDNLILMTASLAAVVAAQKGAALDGVDLEIGTWDTDRSPVCTLTMNYEGHTECTTSPPSQPSPADPSELR